MQKYLEEYDTNHVAESTWFRTWMQLDQEEQDAIESKQKNMKKKKAKGFIKLCYY